MKRQILQHTKNWYTIINVQKYDPLDLANWRTITIINVDYKIAAYCLAQRIKPVIPKIISTDQNGFINGRNISYNIRIIQDIIDNAEKFEENGAILFLDFAKALETLKWNFMFETLKYFGFKTSFMQWVTTMYNDITCKVTNNGWISTSLNISRDIRQGCPLLSLLFVMTVETMAARVRQDKNIKSIKLFEGQDKDFKILQLADDKTLFLKTKQDIRKTLNLIEIFGSLSGLVLNRSKSHGIKLGNNKILIEDDFEDIDWSSTSVKALGSLEPMQKKSKSKLGQQNQQNRKHHIILEV